MNNIDNLINTSNNNNYYYNNIDIHNCFILLDDISSYTNIKINFNRLSGNGWHKYIYKYKSKI